MVFEEVLQRVPSSELRAEIAWVPILDGDTREAAAQAAGRFVDGRARHYFDADQALGLDVGRALKIPPAKRDAGRAFGVAWDVYLVYGKGAVWSGEAPSPAFWMHQLDQVPESVSAELDGAALRAQVEQALAEVGAAP